MVIYRFVTPGTVDERIIERAAEKAELEKIIMHKVYLPFLFNFHAHVLVYNNSIDLCHNVKKYDKNYAFTITNPHLHGK